MSRADLLSPAEWDAARWAFITILQGMRARRYAKAQEVCPDGGLGCRYKTEMGMKCAVGLLIPDERYDPEFEGMSVAQILKAGALAGTEFEGCPAGLLVEMQHAHDASNAGSKHAHFENMARKVAREWGFPHDYPKGFPDEFRAS
jgi:hypothetical protein